MIVPDKWKEGASNTTEGGGRKINENKLLSKKKRLLFVLPFILFVLVNRFNQSVLRVNFSLLVNFPFN